MPAEDSSPDNRTLLTDRSAADEDAGSFCADVPARKYRLSEAVLQSQRWIWQSGCRSL